VKAYIARRVATQLLVLLASSVVVFGFLHLAPGGPAKLLLAGRPVTQSTIDDLNRRYGLDRSLPAQYVTWLGNIAHGDLGESIRERTPVADAVIPRFKTTLELTAYAVVLMLLVGIPLGVLSAVHRSGPVDVGATLGTLGAASIPPYVSGVVLIVLFAVKNPWFPSIGCGHGFVGTIDHLTLPAIALALSALALISRVTRAAMIEALASEAVETARVRGFSSRRVIFKHALRAALLPVVTMTGIVIGYLLSGAILVEYVFSINGLGLLLVRSVQSLDYAVVQAIALIITAEFLLINLFVDLLYGVIDPRVRLGRRAS
jgi:peptide/nickel transport system permease protein